MLAIAMHAVESRLAVLDFARLAAIAHAARDGWCIAWPTVLSTGPALGRSVLPAGSAW
jgi:hypothetical protein